METTELENVVKWLEYDYLSRIGAYRNDCKQGCDACMPMHNGDDYCDIDMLCKILALLKEQEPKPVGKEWNECPNCGKVLSSIEHIHFCGMCGQAVKWE